MPVPTLPRPLLSLALCALLSFADVAQARGVAEQLLSELASQAFSVRPEKQEKAYKPREVPASAAQALYSAGQRAPGFASCTGLFPGGNPVVERVFDARYLPVGLCSDSFAVLHSSLSKTPLVVVERLSRAQIRDAKGEERTDAFYADPRLPKTGRAELSDYRETATDGGRKDRGHLAPAGNAPTPGAMAQSFALSNMVPQDPTHNRKIWNKLESDVRKYVERASGNVFVYSGPLFEGTPATIGKGRVWVPTHLFKLVYDEGRQRAWAYVIENRGDVSVTRPLDYAAFVQRTRLPLLGAAPVTGSIAP